MFLYLFLALLGAPCNAPLALLSIYSFPSLPNYDPNSFAFCISQFQPNDFQLPRELKGGFPLSIFFVHLTVFSLHELVEYILEKKSEVD